MDTRSPKQRFDISLEDLQTFIAVADHGSFSRAADRLALSQPSVSNRVRRLEEKLGVRLLDRNTRSVALTMLGRRLHERAATPLAGLHTLLREFDDEVTLARAQVDVSTTMMIATVILPSIVAAFADAHPGISVRIKDRLPDAARKAVVEGGSDMAIMTLQEDDPALDFEPLITDHCVVVTALRHRLVELDRVTLADVLAYSILSPADYASLRDPLAIAAAARGLCVTLAPEASGVTNTITLIAMATAGLGVAIQPSTMIPPEFRSTIGIVEIADCRIERTFGIVTAKARPLSAEARRFRAYLRKTAPS